MTRYHPYTNPATGALECLYAGCGREIPADHYLCRKHYARLGDGSVEPCPGEGCGRFKSRGFPRRCGDVPEEIWASDPRLLVPPGKSLSAERWPLFVPAGFRLSPE